MDFFCAALVQKISCLTKLRPADDGVIDHQQALSRDEFVDGDELHLRYQVPAALYGRHEGTRPGGGIFYKRTRIWDAGFVGVAHGVSDAGVGYAGRAVRPDMLPGFVSPCQHPAASVTDVLDVQTFVSRAGKAIVYPKEAADPHIFECGGEGLFVFAVKVYDLAGSQFSLRGIAQIEI